MIKKRRAKMGPDNCCLCNGKLKEGKTELVVKVEEEFIIIKEVPALICEDCGEKYFTPAISKKIDEVMKDYFEGKTSKLPLSLIPAREVELSA